MPTALGLIDWGQFFSPSAQPAGAIDTKLAPILLRLPFIPAGENSLATRNMLRAQSFRLPSGQAVAAEIERLCGREIERAPMDQTGLPREMWEHSPLWVYVLAEGLLTGGERLGPVGGRLIAEVLIGLLECDPTSYLGSNRNWVPEFTRDVNNNWDMKALIDFAYNGTYAWRQSSAEVGGPSRWRCPFSIRFGQERNIFLPRHSVAKRCKAQQWRK